MFHKLADWFEKKQHGGTSRNAPARDESAGQGPPHGWPISGVSQPGSPLPSQPNSEIWGPQPSSGPFAPTDLIQPLPSGGLYAGPPEIIGLHPPPGSFPNTQHFPNNVQQNTHNSSFYQPTSQSYPANSLHYPGSSSREVPNSLHYPGSSSREVPNSLHYPGSNSRDGPHTLHYPGSASRDVPNSLGMGPRYGATTQVSTPFEMQYPSMPAVFPHILEPQISNSSTSHSSILSPPVASPAPGPRRLSQGLSRSQQINPAVRAISVMMDAPTPQTSGHIQPTVSNHTSFSSQPSHGLSTIGERSSAPTLTAQAYYQPPAAQHQTMASVPGLVHGDPFLVAVAPHYKWSTAVLTGLVAVEEGINAARVHARNMLAAQGTGGTWRLPNDTPGPPPVQLTRQEVQEQIELMVHGLIGQGSTSMVFKCCWPSKFGAKALLAVKVLRNPYCEHLQEMIAAFQYEADVLSRCRHPNVVRLYGYCLEPPCVCLIMELLPTTLKSRLYGSKQLRGTLGTVPSSEGQSSQLATEGPSRAHNAATGGASSDEQYAILPHELQQLGLGISNNRLMPWASVDTSVGSRSQVPSQLQTVLEQGPSKASPVLPLTDAEILKIGADVAAALAHLHAKPEDKEQEEVTQDPFAEPYDDTPPPPALGRVVHRDLKPANILINSKGVAKISDFGLAREHHSTTIELDQRAAGTLHYMAPELMSEDIVNKITDRVDIYSLGMILWEMAAGQVPWNGRKDQEILALVTSNQRPQLKPEQPRTGLLQRARYAALVSSCWNEKPERRPKASMVQAQLVKEAEKLQAAATAATASQLTGAASAPPPATIRTLPVKHR